MAPLERVELVKMFRGQDPDTAITGVTGATQIDLTNTCTQKRNSMIRNSLTSLVAAAVIFGLTFGSAANSDAKEFTLYKNPQCGCCEDYAKYLRENGFIVTVKPTRQLVAMSREAGLPDNFQGCHLSHIDGYFVSGHVPVAIVNRLLSERPDIRGITLPNMPQGSPGMSGTKAGPFTIFAIGSDQPRVYAVD